VLPQTISWRCKLWFTRRVYNPFSIPSTIGPIYWAFRGWRFVSSFWHTDEFTV
jgi:hypothetical protein